MKSLNTNKVFVSAYRTDKTYSENEQNHSKAIELLKREGFNYRVVTGVWKGVQERSILLEANDYRTHSDHVDAALGIARLFNQDAVLEVAHDGHAVIHDTGSGSGSKPIGTFRETSKEDALNRDGYTFDVVTDRYFVVD